MHGVAGVGQDGWELLYAKHRCMCVTAGKTSHCASNNPRYSIYILIEVSVARLSRGNHLSARLPHKRPGPSLNKIKPIRYLGKCAPLTSNRPRMNRTDLPWPVKPQEVLISIFEHAMMKLGTTL